MKSEDSKPQTPAAQPATTPSTPAATATTTPAPTYTAAPWPAAQVTTDSNPATAHQPIQYQHYQAYSSHYPQAAYGHYQYATQLTTQLTTQAMQAQLSRSATVTTPAPTIAQPAATTSAANASSVDTADIATLNDALGSAGVDLRAEEESLQRSHDQHQPYRPYEDRTRKQPAKPAFDTTHLGSKMRTIGTSHKVTRVPDDCINYLALALRARLQDLITNMISASHHRTDTQFDRPASLYSDNTPMWSIVVRSDVAKQLSALEKVEREEEMKVRRERKERAEMTAAHAAVLAAQANGAAVGTTDGSSVGGAGEEEGGAKKKRKKDGPGVTARNMSEDVRKKMSNAVATQAAGLGGKYAWMTAANVNTPAPKPKPAAAAAPATTTTAAAAATATTTTPSTGTTATVVTTTTAASSTPTTSAVTTTTPAMTATSTWARPYVPTKKLSSTMQAQPTAEEDTRTTVTMRDAIFVIEKERGHGGGRGTARGFI